MRGPFLLLRIKNNLILHRPSASRISREADAQKGFGLEFQDVGHRPSLEMFHLTLNFQG
jgi:hypothetical protein